MLVALETSHCCSPNLLLYRLYTIYICIFATMDYFNISDEDLSLVDFNETVPFVSTESTTLQQLKTVLLPIIFGIITVVGFAGNLPVLVAVLSKKQMRNTTNLLIVNLTVADFLSIVLCAPFTATVFAIDMFPFGNAFCKIHFYLTHVTTYPCL